MKCLVFDNSGDLLTEELECYKNNVLVLILLAFVRGFTRLFLTLKMTNLKL